MRIRARVIILAMVMASAASSQTLDVKGLALGATLAQARVALPGIECQPVPGAQFRKYADNSCSTGITYGGEYAEISAWAFGDEVGQIIVRGKNDNWHTVRSGLTEKYGKPSSVAAPTVQTLGGASLESEKLHWKLASGDTVDAWMHADATHYQVVVTSSRWWAENKRREGKPGADM